MPNFVYADNVSTTLAAPITSPTQTSITLTSAANLPTIAAGQTLALTLNDAATQSVFEILYVTARSGATLTVERGQEGTAATTWLSGDYAYASVTAGILQALGAEGVDGINGLSGSVTIESTDNSITITEPGGNAIDLTLSGSVVKSINSETGAVTFTSAAGSVLITEPSAGVVNLEVSSGAVATSVNAQTGAVTIESTDSSLTVSTPGGSNVNLVVNSAHVVKSLNGQVGAVAITSTDGSLAITATGSNVNIEWSPPQRSYGGAASTNSSSRITITVPYVVTGAAGTIQQNTGSLNPYTAQLDQQLSNFANGVVVFYALAVTSSPFLIGAGVGIAYSITTNNTAAA